MSKFLKVLSLVTLVIGFSLSIPHSSRAAVFNVSTAAELQAALTAAESNGENDEINLAAGTFNTSDNGAAPFSYISAEAFSLTLQGQGGGTTLLDGGGSGGTQVMRLNINSTNAPLTVRGITFQNGDATIDGGGLGISVSDSNVDIAECEFLTNTTTAGAGGLDIVLSGVGIMTIDNNIFQGNNGDGSFGPGGAYVLSSGGLLTFTNNQLNGNTANADDTDSFSPGGAFIESILGGLQVNNNVFDNNTGGEGNFSPGGAFVQGFGGQNIFQGNTVTNNNAVGSGTFSPGGVFFQSFDESATVTDNTINNNSGGVGAFSAGGAFVQAFDAPATVSRNTFSENDASNCSNCPGGAFVQLYDADHIMDGNTFWNNTADAGNSSPGGIFLQGDGGTLAFVNNIFGSNSSIGSEGGAGIDWEDFPINITNNTFGLNSGGGNGGGLSVDPSTDTTVVNLFNNIVFGNSTTGIGQDIFVANAGAPAAPVNLFNNDFGELCLESPATCDFTTLGANQGNNIQQDPLFVDAAAGNFQLSDNSPAIDMGTDTAPSLPTTDHDGNPRIIGGQVDMGALEVLAQLTVDPLNHDYGEVATLDSSTLILTLTNTGSLDVLVSAMTLSDTTNYSLDFNGGSNPCGTDTPTLQPGESCTVAVIFSPTFIGLIQAVLSIDSNDTLNPMVTVTLIGTGVGTGANGSLSGGGCALEKKSPRSPYGNLMFLLLPMSLFLFFRKKETI